MSESGGSRDQRRSVHCESLPLWADLDADEGLRFSPGFKTSSKWERVSLENGFESRSVPNKLMNGLEGIETKSTEIQASIQAILSKKEFPHPRSDATGPLSASLKRICQDSSSSPPIPADAIPTICLPPSPLPVRYKESPIYVLDFEKELVAALLLDISSRADEFFNRHSDRNDRDSHSFDSSIKLHGTHRIVVKTQDPSDNVFDEHLIISSCNNDPQQIDFSSLNGKTQLQEDQPKDECCPSSRLSYDSNVTPSRSVSYAFNVTLVLASKAVRAGHIRVLINGLPAVQSENAKCPASAFDNNVPEGKEVGFILDGGSVMEKLGFNAWKPDSGGNPNDALTTLGSNGNAETTDLPTPGGFGEDRARGDAEDIFVSLPISSPSEDRGSNHLSDHRHVSPVSPLGTPEASQTPLGDENARVPENHHQPPKGHSAIDKLRNIGKFRRTSGAGPADGPHKKAFSRLSVCLYQLPWASLIFVVFVQSFWLAWLPPRSDMSSTYSYGDPNSYYSNSIQSGYDTSNKSFQGQPPPPEGYFAPLYPSQTLPSGPDLVEGFPEPQFRGVLSSAPPQQPQYTIPDTAPYQQDQLQPTREQLSPDGSNIPSQPTPIPPTTRKPDPPTRGRFYAQALRLRSRSPTRFPPRPNEKNIPISDPSNPVHGLGIFKTQPTTCRSGDQERPWSITIPGDDSMDQMPGKMARARKQFASLPPDIEETTQDLQGQKTTERAAQSRQKDAGHPHRGEGGTTNETLSPAELRVTKHNSSEEIFMSSTAYPGQEWKPPGFGEWEYY
ncbi:hypothetical protein PHISCL_04852 [Aspergillus sclerotialis]|uniref:Uncharacterized protein n=1 Tax=Aspergillus sclerotialis TaxID=2070753 RepID=A0A3A2ZU21_9EURO|nr:hypothetical protein PHISCL_04852 [Aspergillus sclerotialis]